MPLDRALEERLKVSGRETPLPPYAQELIRGVIERGRELDSIIVDAAPDWTLERMPAVDRNLLRIASWEILCNDEVAPAVAIDEAVTLASDLSTDDSPRFINGVLGRITREAPALGSVTAETRAEDARDIDGGSAAYSDFADD